MNTKAWLWTAFVVVLAFGATGLFFWADPKMTVPSVIGVVGLIALIFLFYKKVDTKPWEDQKKIAIGAGRIGWVMVVVLMGVFFYFGAQHNNMHTMDFFRLLTGL